MITLSKAGAAPPAATRAGVTTGEPLAAKSAKTSADTGKSESDSPGSARMFEPKIYLGASSAADQGWRWSFYRVAKPFLQIWQRKGDRAE